MQSEGRQNPQFSRLYIYIHVLEVNKKKLGDAILCNISENESELGYRLLKSVRLIFSPPRHKRTAMRQGQKT